MELATTLFHLLRYRITYIPIYMCYQYSLFLFHIPISRYSKWEGLYFWLRNNVVRVLKSFKWSLNIYLYILTKAVFCDPFIIDIFVFSWISIVKNVSCRNIQHIDEIVIHIFQNTTTMQNTLDVTIISSFLMVECMSWFSSNHGVLDKIYPGHLILYHLWKN